MVNSKRERPTPINIIIKLSKDKGKKENLESSEREVIHHVQVIPNKIQTDFSLEIMKARKLCDDIFEVVKEKIMSKISYPAKLSFEDEKI